MLGGQAVGLAALEGAQFGHLGQDHGHDFQAIDFVFGKQPRFAALDDQHAQPFTHPLDRHAQKAGKHFLAGFGHEAETGFRGRIGSIDVTPGAGHAPHQSLAQAQAGAVDGFGAQALGRAEFQGDLVKPVLAAAGGAQDPLQPLQQLA